VSSEADDIVIDVEGLHRSDDRLETGVMLRDVGLRFGGGL
jgi:hypothetical protein